MHLLLSLPLLFIFDQIFSSLVRLLHGVRLQVQNVLLDLIRLLPLALVLVGWVFLVFHYVLLVQLFGSLPCLILELKHLSKVIFVDKELHNLNIR